MKAIKLPGERYSLPPAARYISFSRSVFGTNFSIGFAGADRAFVSSAIAIGMRTGQEFAKWAIREGAFQAADLDGLSIQEKAHELGLIEATTYDPEQHGPSDVAETGDEWFVFAPILTAAGYRILGPDEVDQVTVDKCAVEADEHGRAWGPSMASPAIIIAAAIRSIGRKA